MSASTAVQLALCTGERRDRASRAWKVVGQIKERVVLPEVRNWHGKASIFGQPYSQGVWGLRFVKRTREDQLHRPRCKGFAQAPCPVSRPTGRVHIIGHQSRLHRKSIQSTRISELDGVQTVGGQKMQIDASMQRACDLTWQRRRTEKC